MCTLTHLFSLSTDIILSLKVGTIMLSPSLLPSPSPSSACRHAKPLQSCLTLCDLICSPLGSSVHEILQAAILEWVAKPSSRESSQPRDRTHVSYICCIGRWVLYHQSLCHIRVSCSKWDMTQVSAPPVMGATDTPLALPQGAGMGAPQLGAPPAEWASQATPSGSAHLCSQILSVFPLIPGCPEPKAASLGPPPPAL